MNTNHLHKKHNKRLTIGLLSLLIFVVSLTTFNLFFTPVYIVEDISNSCNYDGDNVALSTAAGSKDIFIKLPGWKVQSYLTQARSENRCVNEVPDPATDYVLQECKSYENKTHCATDYIGLSLDSATTKAESNGWRWRIVENLDTPNDSIGITDDASPERVNFTIKQDKVALAEFY